MRRCLNFVKRTRGSLGVNDGHNWWLEMKAGDPTRTAQPLRVLGAHFWLRVAETEQRRDAEPRANGTRPDALQAAGAKRGVAARAVRDAGALGAPLVREARGPLSQPVNFRAVARLGRKRLAPQTAGRRPQLGMCRETICARRGTAAVTCFLALGRRRSYVFLITARCACSARRSVTASSFSATWSGSRLK